MGGGGVGPRGRETSVAMLAAACGNVAKRKRSVHCRDHHSSYCYHYHVYYCYHCCDHDVDYHCYYY